MPNQSKITNDYVNLEELVSNYVWKMFKVDKHPIRKLFLRRSDYQFVIKWEYVEFSHVTNTPDENVSEQSGRTQSKEDGGEEDHARRPDEKNVPLYKSEYENKTDTTQVYKFTATRQTAETTRVEMKETYTLGLKTNLSLNLGDIAKLGVEIAGSLSVTETQVQEYSKSLTWSIDTEIKVPPWYKAEAELAVYEVHKVAKFQVKTTLRLPTEGLPVSMIRIKDGKRVYVGSILNLKVIFDGHDESCLQDSNVRIFKEDIMRHGIKWKVNVVELTTRGTCRHVKFRNQLVKVTCTPLPNASADVPPLHENIDS